jgi:hypothetical protein
MTTTKSVGKIMTKKLETIAISDSQSEMRRSKVIEMRSRGQSQTEIARFCLYLFCYEAKRVNTKINHQNLIYLNANQ